MLTRVKPCQMNHSNTVEITDSLLVVQAQTPALQSLVYPCFSPSLQGLLVRNAPVAVKGSMYLYFYAESHLAIRSR